MEINMDKLKHTDVHSYEENSINIIISSDVFEDNNYVGYTKEMIQIIDKDSSDSIIIELYHNYRIEVCNYKNLPYNMRIFNDVSRSTIKSTYLNTKYLNFYDFFKLLYKVYNKYDEKIVNSDNIDDIVSEIDNYTNRYYDTYILELFIHFFVLFKYMKKNKVSIDSVSLHNQSIEFTIKRYINQIRTDVRECNIKLPDIEYLCTKMSDIRNSCIWNVEELYYNSYKHDVYISYTVTNNIDFSVPMSNTIRTTKNRALEIIYYCFK